MNLQRKLDRIFSEFIRLRDSNKDGYGCCISCGKIIHWKEGHCGHYINRRHLSLRYDEQNCNLQCVKCNSFDEGNNIGYTRGLIKKYGDRVIELISIKKFNYCSLGKVEYETLIKIYQNKLKKTKDERK